LFSKKKRSQKMSNIFCDRSS